MNTNFRIALISDNPFHLGLLKGYCYVHHYNVIAVDSKSISELNENSAEYNFYWPLIVNPRIHQKKLILNLVAGKRPFP